MSSSSRGWTGHAGEPWSGGASRAEPCASCRSVPLPSRLCAVQPHGAVGVQSYCSIGQPCWAWPRRHGGLHGLWMRQSRNFLSRSGAEGGWPRGWGVSFSRIIPALPAPGTLTLLLGTMSCQPSAGHCLLALEQWVSAWAGEAVTGQPVLLVLWEVERRSEKVFIAQRECGLHPEPKL